MESTVSIITRTKDRVQFLRRTLEDIINQTFKNFIWIVVNDGGNEQLVNEVISAALEKQIACRVVHHKISLGMEAASNRALGESQNDFVVIHDDDDTWHPDFLMTTVNFLNSKKGQLYGGVITHSQKIIESINGDVITELSRESYNTNLHSVYLYKMAQGNFFPPISFVFRRSALLTVGVFDETLPVRGDWDFNLRFLLHFDIGVIPKPLANWHHRQNANDSAANSFTGAGSNLHKEYDAIIRNKYLRNDIANGKFGLGFLLNNQIFPNQKSKKSRVSRFWSLLRRIIG